MSSEALALRHWYECAGCSVCRDVRDSMALEDEQETAFIEAIMDSKSCQHEWSADGVCGKCLAQWVGAVTIPEGMSDEQALKIAEYLEELDRKKRKERAN